MWLSIIESLLLGVMCKIKSFNLYNLNIKCHRITLHMKKLNLKGLKQVNQSLTTRVPDSMALPLWTICNFTFELQGISQLLGISEAIPVLGYNSLKMKLEFWKEVEKCFLSALVLLIYLRSSKESGKRTTVWKWLTDNSFRNTILNSIRHLITPTNLKDAAKGSRNPTARAITTAALVVRSPIL